MPADALPLITWENNKYKLHESGLAAVEAIKGPVAVVSVAGLYRTGKSYLLNRLLDRQSGFDVGPTINPCTKGIYVWGTPIRSPTHGDVHIVLIDTEGLGSFDASATHDVKIFSLAILLSSYFIYNSMGTIDENALDKLSLVTHLTEHIQLRTNTKSKEQDSAMLAKYFPRFLWVVRDFSLQLRDESNAPITEAEYLERALSEKHGGRAEEKNAIRKAIKRFFPFRDCVTLVRPVESEAKLQSIDKTPYKDLRDEFRKKMLRNKILSEAEPKRDGSSGALISGTAWAALVRKYVEALNKGAVPNISDSWASVVAKEGQRAVDEAVAALLAALPKEVAREDDWEAAKLRARTTALATFRSVAIGSEEDVASHRQTLEKRMERELKEALLQAELRLRENTRAAAHAALDQAFSNWMEKVRAGVISDPTAVFSEWDTIAKRAISALKGLASEHRAVLAEFTANKLPLAHTAVHNQLQAAQMKRMEEFQTTIRQKDEFILAETRKAQAAESKAAISENSLEREKERSARAQEELKDLKEAKKSWEKEKTGLQAKIEQLGREIETLKVERDQARNQQASHQETSAKSQHALRIEKDDLHKQLKAKEAEIAQKVDDLKRLEKDLKAKEKEETQLRIRAKEAEEHATKQLREMASEMASKAENVHGVAQEVNRLEAELQTKDKEIAEKKRRIADLEAALRATQSAPPPAAAAASLPVTVVGGKDEKSAQKEDEDEDELESESRTAGGKRGRSPAAGTAKRAKNAKGEKVTPAPSGTAEEVYNALTMPKLKRVLLDANVKAPVGKTSKPELVALCVSHDAQCRPHIAKD